MQVSSKSVSIIYNRSCNICIKPSFYIIAYDRCIAENTASDRQRLYGNTFQLSGNRGRSYQCLSDSSNPEIVSDHSMKTRLYSRRINIHRYPYRNCEFLNLFLSYLLVAMYSV